ncbi:MAG: LysM peptidoglycan-binding domain-containing protein [Patescibacteria group bacterium]|nr:LysM peptidoglycan-binding domain-containing protein [Patescibacteria group bacterium]
MKPNKSDIFDSMDVDRDWIHTEVLGDNRKRGGFLSILTFILVLICAVALIFIAFKDMFGKDDLSNLENLDKVKQEQQAIDDKAKQDAAAKALADQQAQQQAAQEMIYTVKAGDTLAAIADEFKVDMNKIAEANGLTTPYELDVGQQLKIPGVAKPANTAPAGGSAAPAGSGNTYTVKSGETLAGIGADLGIDYKTIATLNNLQSPYNLEVGQVLKLPAKQ